jgi:hypothetical protein
MDEIVCTNCNKILPDINEISISVKRRLDFFIKGIKGYSE